MCTDPVKRTRRDAAPQMPFADDIRKYTFPPLENLINKKGERVAKHPYIPTDAQMDAMGQFVDAMDLMQAGEKDEEGYAPPPLLPPSLRARFTDQRGPQKPRAVVRHAPVLQPRDPPHQAGALPQRGRPGPLLQPAPAPAPRAHEILRPAKACAQARPRRHRRLQGRVPRQRRCAPTPTPTPFPIPSSLFFVS